VKTSLLLALALAEPTGHAAHLLRDTVAPDAPVLAVHSPAFAEGGTLPCSATQYGADRFPGLTWGPAPAGTKSWAVVVQGETGASGDGATSVHLVVTNLPATTRALPAGLAALPRGAAYGTNVHGPASGYAGPHPHDAAPHAYTWQVIALDTALPTAASQSMPQLAAAMAGHVLATGATVSHATRPEGDSAACRSSLVVHTQSGLVAGIAGRNPDIAVFRGIPYAAPPVGPLRWRPPAQPLPWTGLRRADSFGPACPQPGTMAQGLPQSEDCLTLNVWTGAKRRAGEKRPVFVWIYGGGFIGGTGASPEFDGESLARQGVVVVTFNYRVGVLGFLATPELSQESGHNASGNYGLLDDIAALQWVKRNIAAFGGDPAAVTIGGQSAGAGSVGFMAMSPLARGLFRAGILESHARHPGDTELRYLSVSHRMLPEAEAAGTAYATEHGAPTLAALRAMPWQDLIKGSDTIDAKVETGSDGKPPLFRPVVDGWVLPATYAETFARHAQNKVTIVAGNNHDETGAVPDTAIEPLRLHPPVPRAGMPQVNVTLAAYLAAAHRKFGPMADQFLKLYPATTDDEAAHRNNEAAHDMSRVSTWLWGQLWTPGSPLPVYTYFWTHAPPGPDHDMRGAFHGSEIAYVFDSLDVVNRPWTDQDRRIAHQMSAYWANIIAHGNPNGPGLPTWPRYAPQIPRVMELGDHFAPIPVAGADKIAFWKRFFASQPQW
jgi:para-nitrobenzyl esterase